MSEIITNDEIYAHFNKYGSNPKEWDVPTVTKRVEILRRARTAFNTSGKKYILNTHDLTIAVASQLLGSGNGLVEEAVESEHSFLPVVISKENFKEITPYNQTRFVFPGEETIKFHTFIGRRGHDIHTFVIKAVTLPRRAHF